VARWLCRNFPLDGGSDSIVALVITMVASLLVSFLGVLVGEWYSITIEMIRVGNGHLSYRTQRIPWTQHHFGIFLSGVVLFLLVSGLRYRAGVQDGVGPRRRQG